MMNMASSCKPTGIYELVGNRQGHSIAKYEIVAMETVPATGEHMFSTLQPVASLRPVCNFQAFQASRT